jgi:hypothetical protein
MSGVIEQQRRIFEAFEESSILYGEILRIWQKGDSWRVTTQTSGVVRVWAALPNDDGFDFVEEEAPEFEFEQKAGVGDRPEFDEVKYLKEYAQRLQEQQLKQRVSLQMTREIENALVWGLTPTTCEVVIALATAARNTLMCLEHGPWTNPTENLQKLAMMQGLGDEAQFEGPFPNEAP